MLKNNILLVLFIAFASNFCFAQVTVPASYTNIFSDDQGIYLKLGDRKIYSRETTAPFTKEDLLGAPVGSDIGINFNFGTIQQGLLYYGFIPYGDSKHPTAVYFKKAVKIEDGIAKVSIKEMSGNLDMINWAQNEKGVLGYRILNTKGEILYDGRVAFTGKGPFKIDTTITEGPLVNLLEEDGCTLYFETNFPTILKVNVDGKEFKSAQKTRIHEIKIGGLEGATKYKYQVSCGSQIHDYTFTTAPRKGSRTPFTFAYASDSRRGNGGGERDVYGANNYIMKRVMALAYQNNAAFLQFTGDMIDGYLNSTEEMLVQYANWKRGVEPFWHHMPIYIGMGNHEVMMRSFVDSVTKTAYAIDRFPFDTESSEAIFSRAFVNPTNGPQSEDGSKYDPNTKTNDFPSYKENVFSYTHNNVAVIVLNSNYFFSPTKKNIPYSSGNLHGFIMDNQLAWFQQTLFNFEKDPNIDHIFVTQHTPTFPNGGHVKDDMWYNGDNTPRPYVAGKPYEQGIIERRDELLNLMISRSNKVRAILTGDEHNYNKTEIGPKTPIYLPDYTGKKYVPTRTIYQINNGSAGAPYYAKEQTPWSNFTTNFSTQYAVVLVKVDGKKVSVQVLNPDTLEEIDAFDLVK